MRFRDRNLKDIADCIVGDRQYFPYRSSFYITQFFDECDLPYVHDGSTRWWWTAERLKELLEEPCAKDSLPEKFINLLRILMYKSDATEDDPERINALMELNKPLSREGFEAFYGNDNILYVRNIRTNNLIKPSENPHRPFTEDELKKRELLINFLERCSEDELIEKILLPLFRILGFQRITVAGHKDKALEYGKDIWMKFTLPTQHIIYFGIQVKKGKLDSSGMTKAGNHNIAEIYNQTTMMLGHEIFDPETNKRVLVDHAYIIAGGEITKAARNWLGNKLDANKRSQIIFMDREDILNLFTVNLIEVPQLS
ncbi:MULTISPECIES: restriction endonuclease [Acinetobacter]|uniref:Restriction endonuclease n=1 Tax=Acinetobacter geminorum TaxID=2730922 RepID=A0ABT8ZAM3_9GAMM|nr:MULTISPECIES: restriction endonuclease [Acinetobacter]MDV7426940.1 restriction endonuclease [Acinetobacter baumannii]MCU4362152.1 restriction endonuclease [Acinetobacter sp. WU_MDCI_Abxc22]MDO7361427.1 restriction endonuclease [Acinetobacter geminorum]MDS7957157.1 restriction endonuclease [Acinetobacter sp. V104_13]MDS7983489.1 restriction endonuclease [Acinetobacter sp. V104_3]